MAQALPLELTENSPGNSFRFLKHGIPWEFVKWHFHPEYELHQIVKTDGKLFIGDSVIHFEEGSLFLIGPYTPHNFVSDVAPDTVIPDRDLVVQFKREWFDGCAKALVEFAALVPALDEAVFGVHYGRDTAREVLPLLSVMNEVSSADRLAGLITILDRLSRCPGKQVLGKSRYVQDMSTVSLGKFRKAVDFIMSNIEDEIRLESVAEHVHMNYKTFSRWFTECTGIGFRKFVIKARINRSREFLFLDQHTIQEICFLVGFNNVSNFNRVFKQATGMTPSEFRRRSIEKKNFNFLYEAD
jgi:AraC-like DNA-binding protein